MKFLLDENVSLGLAEILRQHEHTVDAIAETALRGLSDDEVWMSAKQSSSILITRDYHFTNPARFDPREIGAILFIRQGRLTAQEEIMLVLRFLEQYPLASFEKKLITLSKSEIKIR
jgi:predicted nuclease of predicted toxin-antitoxin system